jgi:FG-GAP-like repeat
VATGDFNGDGLTDIAYRRISDGLTELQFLNGTTAIGGGAIANNPFDNTWNVVGAGDFNGDGTSDLVYQHRPDNLIEIQFLNGTTTAIGGGPIANNPFDASWNVVAIGDFNKDGKADLVWQHPGNGLTEIQFLNGTTAVGGGMITNNAFGAGWDVVGSGDFNGDGNADLVWAHQGDHQVEVQFLNGTTTAIGGGLIPGSPFGSDWSVVGTGDFNGDGLTDLVYRRVNDGVTEVQFLHGTTPIGGGIVSLGGLTQT